MELSVEYVTGPVQVLVRGPRDSEELLRIMALLRGEERRLWVWDEERNTVGISPSEIVWAETLEDKVFVYTAGAIYRTAMKLGELESRWEDLGLSRCAKSTVVNLNAVQKLSIRPGGRIECLLCTGERILVSRRYAPMLRARVSEGG